jgi:hypothetical protein
MDLILMNPEPGTEELGSLYQIEALYGVCCQLSVQPLVDKETSLIEKEIL